MAERLKTRALNSAIAHLRKWSDTDLFPRPFEIEALYSTWPMAGKFIEATDLGAHQWSASSRRAIIPKDRLGYRVGMQLDPIDSLVLTALIYQYGRQIERTRVKTTENIVFSYRLRPLVGGQLYDPAFNWAAFWQRLLALANESKVRHVLVADVSDYYNQVYHHTVEQQLARANLPREVV
ncbi:MAG TPA: Retron-type reverse transcriptase, partial [bacterium]|nr:Retron-type reverse transcriptase [bacterium]